MSNFHKSALALAVAAGLAFSGTAFAFQVGDTANTLPEGVAFFDVPNNSTQIGIWQTQIQAVVAGTDNLVGRSTGFGIRFTLSGGALFPITPGFGTGPALPAGWTTNTTGGAGLPYFTVTFVPPSSPGVGIQPGVLVWLYGEYTSEILPSTLDSTRVTNAGFLSTPGATVSDNWSVFDPVTLANLYTGTQPLIVSGNPTVAACTPTSGDVSKKIDVGTNGTNPSRSLFSSTGAIGLLDANYFNAGTINYSISSAANFSYFAYAPATDQFTTTVTGNFGAFAQAGASVFLSASAVCATQDIPLTLNAGATQASGTYFASAIPGFTTTGGSAYVCFSVPGGNQQAISATPVSVSTSFIRNALTVNDGTCSELPMNYNGPVVHVYTFNPSGNTTQQSFLRVSNTGPVAGPVFITGVDDAGHPGAGTVTLNLAAGQSIQLTSTDLQNGNASKGLTGALGTPTGKWRLTVLSYFPNLVVSSLNRNNNSGTVTNLTNYSDNGKQALSCTAGDCGN